MSGGQGSDILNDMSSVRFIGVKELKEAVTRHPQTVKRAIDIFLQRGIADYKRGINNNPWRVGGNGGGVPVSNDPRYRTKRNQNYQRARSGNLRDTHVVQRNALSAFIGPSLSMAPYAKMVHDGTRKMKARPWLDFVKEERAVLIQSHYRDMLKTISKSLSK